MNLSESILRKLAAYGAYVRPGGRTWWVEADPFIVELSAEEIAYLAALIAEENDPKRTARSMSEPSECPLCSALVVDRRKHTLWHLGSNIEQGPARTTRLEAWVAEERRAV